MAESIDELTVNYEEEELTVKELDKKVLSESIDELTINYEEDGELTVKELDKKVLSKGAWSTIIYRYQELNRKTGKYGPDKYSIRRYQKRNGIYQQRSKFNISSLDQATQIIEALKGWME